MATPRVELLDDATAERRRAQELTYAEVGATAGELPDGYRHATLREPIGEGAEDFRRASDVLLSWGMQRRAGMRVRASGPVVEPGAVAEMRLGVGPASITIPVRVLHVVDASHRQGFAYGTLPGHPVSGEESFMVELADDGTVHAAITSFSRPATLLHRAGGPAGRAAQAWMTRRYVRALRDA